MKKATCACGRSGKSERPEHYQCGACYYSACAKSNEEKAAKLRERARSLDEEAAEFKRKAEAFAKRHRLPEAKG